MLDIMIRTLRTDYKKKDFKREYIRLNRNTLFTDIVWDEKYNTDYC